MRTLPEGYSIEASSPSMIGFMLNGSHSYVRSTDSHCESRSQNIFRSIKIAIDACSLTARTIPTTNTQWQLIHYKTAMVTSLTAREKAVNLDQFFAIPITLILKLAKHLTPSSIANTTSQLVVANARALFEVASSDACKRRLLLSNCQVLNSNQVVTIDQIGSQLVQKIGTGIADSFAVSRVLATLCAYALHFGVYLGYFKSCFVSVRGAFGFPTQFLLRYFEFLIQLIKMLWVAYLQTFTGGQQIGNSSVNTNLFFSLLQWFNCLVINQQRDEPPARRFKPDCNRRWLTAFWKQSRPDNVQWLITLCEPKLTVSVFKSRFGKLGTTTATLFLEPRIFGSFAPKVSKCFLQMPQALLQRYTANLVEKIQLFSFFPTSKKARGLFIVNSLLSFIPSFGASRQSFVVDKTHTPYCPSPEIFLFGSRVTAVFVSTFDHASHHTLLNVKNIIRGRRFLPSATPWVSTPKKR